MIQFTCDFPLTSKARARLGKGGTYTPQKTKAAEKSIGFICRAAMGARKPMAGPLTMQIVAYFAPPKSWPKKRRAEAMGRPYTCRSDWDNMGKLVSDALNRIAYDDDRQIAHGTVERRYGPKNMFTVTIREAT